MSSRLNESALLSCARFALDHKACPAPKTLACPRTVSFAARAFHNLRNLRNLRIIPVSLSVVALIAASLALPSFAFAAVESTDAVIKAHPAQTQEVLMNPGTGWQMLVNAPPTDEMDRMPLVSTYYYRTSWVMFEPAKGQYEDSPAVRVIDAWLAEARKHGRYVAIRVVPWNSGNSMYSANYSQKVRNLSQDPLRRPESGRDPGMDSTGYDSPVPPYIFEEGADGFVEPGDSGGWVPVFWDPIYLKYQAKLAEFLGKRYGGDPNIAYIDVPAGNYGEMNLTNTNQPWFDDLSLWKKHGLTAQSWESMLRSLCDMYRSAFPNDLLVAARDYTDYPGGKEALPYLVGKGIGFRDDGLGMDYCAPPRTNNEYEANWQSVLCLYENGGGTWLNWGSEERIRAILEWAIDRTHASIVMLGKGKRAQRCYDGCKPLVTEYGLRLGYRLTIDESTWPASVKPGAALPVTLSWRNLGNAPPYVDFSLETTLLAPDGSVACSKALPCETHKWLPGGPYATSVSLDVPSSLAPGAYTVSASVFERSADGGIRRRIRLALDGEKDGRYVLGAVQIE